MTDTRLNADKSAFAMDRYPGHSDFTGLTKREYFAAQVLAGMMANTTTTKAGSRQQIVDASATIADLLLATLEEAKP
jgi:hypothetical protein